ncbi:hypothetical protein ACHAQE_003940 [Botrytis cinerea]
MSRHVLYESEDDFSDDDSSSVISYTDSVADVEDESDSGSERQYRNSRTPLRGRSSSHRPRYLPSDYSDDSDQEEDPDQIIRHPSRSSCVCCEPRYIPPAPVQCSSFVQNSIPTPNRLVPLHSDTAYYYASSEGSNHSNQNNTMIRAPQSRLGDESGGGAWGMRRPIMGEYTGPNPILRELDRQYYMDRELAERDDYERRLERDREEAERNYYERQMERHRYRRNSSSDSRDYYRDQDYPEEGRSSGGVFGRFASALVAAVSGGH